MKNIRVLPGDSIASLAAANAVNFRDILEASKLTPFDNLPNSLLIPDSIEKAQTQIAGALEGLNVKVVDWLFET